MRKHYLNRKRIDKIQLGKAHPYEPPFGYLHSIISQLSKNVKTLLKNCTNMEA